MSYLTTPRPPMPKRQTSSNSTTSHSSHTTHSSTQTALLTPGPIDFSLPYPGCLPPENSSSFSSSEHLPYGPLDPPPKLYQTTSRSSDKYRNSPKLSINSGVASPGALSSPGLGAAIQINSASPVMNSPKSMTMSIGSRSGSGSGSGRRGWEAESELEKTTYMFALRVAALHTHLHAPPAPPRRPSVHAQSPHTPLPPSIPHQPVPSMPRSKSFGLLKKGSSEVKLPKEFLAEFWGVLGNENGADGWAESVQGFLGGVKKGTRSEGGANLREIGTLLDTFSAYIPSSAAIHLHQEHLLQLLAHYLPRSTCFSGPINEKDRDLLRRLRREVASHMLTSSPSDGSRGSNGQQQQQRSASTPQPTYPNGLASPVSMRSNSSGQVPNWNGNGTPNGMEGSESPRWQNESLGEMVELVGLIFGVPRDMLERDIADMKSDGTLEELYVKDIRTLLQYLNHLPTPTSAQRARIDRLQLIHKRLYETFPSLQSPNPSTPRTPSPTSIRELYFTPSKKMEIYSHLCDKAEENMTLTNKASMLIDKCVEIWGVPSAQERHKEVEGLILAWTRCLGRRDEVDIGKELAEGVDDLCCSSQSLNLTDSMDGLLNGLLAVLSKSIHGLFDNQHDLNKTRPPPPSLLPILQAGDGIFLKQVKTKRQLEDLNDELKGRAVGSYVEAVGEMMGGPGGNSPHLGGGSGGSDAHAEFERQIRGLKEVGTWIEGIVKSTRTNWGEGLGEMLNPAAIILSKQLPLFFAELQVLDKPNGANDLIFELFEVSSKLIGMWKNLCPDIDIGFEIDAFFDSHVQAWLKETEISRVHEWVSRAIGMDNWTPVNGGKHSQSVVDLFQFINQSSQSVIQELPLGSYKKAVYMTDFSKIIASAIASYAKCTHDLFDQDLYSSNKATNSPQQILTDKVGGKAGSWLAKGQQAMKALERKRVEAFIIPNTTCTKVTDMTVGISSVHQLSHSMSADENARLIASRARSQSEKTGGARNVFTVTISRGNNLLGKSQSKGADAFVVVNDKEGNERMIKTRTILGTEDPKWEQSFETSVATLKQLEISVFDRALVGSHYLIGSSSFKLDPRIFSSVPTRDIMIPLQPRGFVHVRVSMESTTKQDIRNYLGSASRKLERTAKDMMRELVDKMMEFVRDQLSVRTLQEMTKVKDKKKGKVLVGESELEMSLGGVFEYFNINFATFSTCLTEEDKQTLILLLWNRLIDHLISLLIPPFSDKPYTSPSLSGQEVDIVFRWLHLLKTFFNASENGVEHGIPLSKLQNGLYKDMIVLGQYLDLPTPTLKDRAGNAVKALVSKNAALTGGGGIVNGMSRLGMECNEGEKMAEILLRIARTRNDMGDFLVTQVSTLTRLRIERQAGLL